MSIDGFLICPSIWVTLNRSVPTGTSQRLLSCLGLHRRHSSALLVKQVRHDTAVFQCFDASVFLRTSRCSQTCQPSDDLFLSRYVPFASEVCPRKTTNDAFGCRCHRSRRPGHSVIPR